MHQHIGITVTVQAQTIGMLQRHPAEDQRTTRDQPVDVVAVSDPDLHRRGLMVIRHCPARVEIGATFPGALLPLLLPPGLDRRMIATPQHIGDHHAAEFRRPGVVGMFKEHGAMALLHQGMGRSNGAR